MSDHNLKYDALNSIQHSEIPPTTEEVLNAWNRGSSAGQGQVLLSQDGGGQGAFCAPNELLEPIRYAGGRASDLRSGNEHEGLVGGECEGLDLEVPVGVGSPAALITFILAPIVGVVFWILGFMYLAHVIHPAVR